ncbi:MAG: S41 family peptidase [Candidatus Pacebacteria bacterium]|nr:S41 family peptidase [Candidatus Paceibacterota bacterium]
MFNFFKEKQNRYTVLIAIFTFIIGLYIGLLKSNNLDDLARVFKKRQVDPNQVNLDSFWEVWDTIDQKYPGAKEIDNQERIYGAIKGLVSSLDDPYSTFFTPEEKKIFEEDIDGHFSGVGMEVGIKDDILTVIAPLKDTPAYKAGMKSGDKVLAIDEKTTNDMSTEEAIKLIRGEKGTTVTLTILRPNENKPREIKIVRDIITVPTLETEIKDNAFIIKLYSFTGNSNKLFRDAIKEFSGANTDKLVIDLRGNPGGYLESAVDMASWFLASGKTVLIEDYGEGKEQKIYQSHGYDVFNDNLKLVILIDGGSASASEILAGALRDHNKAKLLGTQSYGKGSVQEVVDIGSDTSLKVTIAKWLTPSGISISKKGLTPDIEIKRGDDEKIDLQMNKALEVLNNWK